MSSQHHIESAEVQKCAIGEGFATFYAVDTFNDHGDSDDSCAFRYWKPGDGVNSGATLMVNCKEGQGTGFRYQRQGIFGSVCTTLDPGATCVEVGPDGTTACDAAPPTPPTTSAGRANDKGLGVELDWTRQFWNIHTNGSGATFEEMMDWISFAQDWTDENGFTKLNSAVNASALPPGSPFVALFSDGLRNNWNNFKCVNTIAPQVPPSAGGCP